MSRAIFSLAMLSAACATGGRAGRILPDHPRLVATPEAWARLERTRAIDPELAGLVALLQAEARQVLPEPPVTRAPIGRRLLSVSRRAEQRILLLAFAYRTTGEAAFLRRAEEELAAVAAFPDWNPEHFLDVAEMTAAVALGYDWLHAELPAELRERLRRAIVEKGLRPGADPAASWNTWQAAEHNWNQVCFAGLTLGALAVAEDEPEISERILSLARHGIEHGLRPYAPDGVYVEGPSYWSYATSYQVMMIAALESAMGTDWGMPASPGFLASAGALLETTGPSGRPFNFSDSVERRSFEPALFWFARRTGDRSLLASSLAQLDEARGLSGQRPIPGESTRLAPLAALWWPGETAGAHPSLPLAWTGRGVVPLIAFRSAWSDPNALWLAAKGGSASTNHAHMDAGSFVLEADGVRWGIDLGSQDYRSLESKGVDLWNRSQGSQRWQVFRLGPLGHGTLVIDGAPQRVDGMAKVAEFSSDGARPHAVLDLSPAYAGQAAEVRRRFDFAAAEREVIVSDALSGLRPGADVRWAMATRAAVEPDGPRAVLRQDGRTLTAQLEAPAGARFEAIPADPPADYDAPNPGVRLLVAHLLAPAGGRLEIRVTLRAER
jgi:hypothetical protein